MITVFYDADCGFCIWAAVRCLRRVRQPVSAGTIQDAREGALAGIDNVLDSFHVLVDGQVHSAGAGLAELLAASRWRWFGSFLRRRPHLADRIYFAVARRRAPLARLLPERSKQAARQEILRYSSGSS